MFWNTLHRKRSHSCTYIIYIALIIYLFHYRFPLSSLKGRNPLPMRVRLSDWRFWMLMRLRRSFFWTTSLIGRCQKSPKQKLFFFCGIHGLTISSYDATNQYYVCVLVYVWIRDASKPVAYVEPTYVDYKITAYIPDIDCPQV